MMKEKTKSIFEFISEYIIFIALAMLLLSGAILTAKYYYNNIKDNKKSTDYKLVGDTVYVNGYPHILEKTELYILKPIRRK